MKRVLLILWISGMAALFSLALLLTGMADAGSAENRALVQGNRQYALGEYEEALRLYQEGLLLNPYHSALNFNAAQAAYKFGEYHQAVQFYEKSQSSAEKFLNSGNASLRLGEMSEDIMSQMNYFTQALQSYYNGIIEFPQDVALKYNYEYLSEKIRELSDNQEQAGGNEGDDSDEGDESDNQEEAGDEQNQPEDGQGQNAEQGDDSLENGPEETEDGIRGQEDGEEAEPDREAIERILRMLEIHEENSLKNNQEIIRGQENGYGW